VRVNTCATNSRPTSKLYESVLKRAHGCYDSGRSRRTAGTPVRPKKLLNALRTRSDSWRYRDFRSKRLESSVKTR
jgi:hypothetical protein